MSGFVLGGDVPRSVAIVAMGGSRDRYLHDTLPRGSRRAAYDETWAINAAGDVLQCDRVFHMDDVRVQQRRADAGNATVAELLGWLKTCPVPVYTSRSHPDFPALEEFPLDWLLRHVPRAYFNSTPAYPLALAIAAGVEEIGLYGMDYTYPNAHKAERGRACVEYWVGWGEAKGVRFRANPYTTLLDSDLPDQARLYGYDTERVAVSDERAVSRLALPESEIPTAAEIEARYEPTYANGAH